MMVRLGGSGFKPGIPISDINIAKTRSTDEAIKRAFRSCTYTGSAHPIVG
jgi:hypothetical protein